MNSRERVLTAIRGGEPDRVPIMELAIEPPIMEKMAPGASEPEFYEAVDVDGVCGFYDLLYEDVEQDVKKDCFGIKRNFTEMQGKFPVPIEPLIPPDQDPMRFLDSYKMPDGEDPRMLAQTRALVERFKGRKATAFIMHTSLIYPTFMRGFDQFMVDLYERPEFVKRLADLFTDFFIGLEEQAIEMGVDLIIDGEDYAGTTSLWMSKTHLEQFILPGLRRAIKVAHDAGVPFVKHCDGRIHAILDLLVDQGIDALNPIEPAAGMDIGDVKVKIGKQVCLWGNVDCSHLLTFGSPEQVREATIECIRKAAPGGGYILGSSNTIHSAVPPENFLAMIEAGREFGEYPIRL